MISAVALSWRLPKAGPEAYAAETGAGEKRALCLVAMKFFLPFAYTTFEVVSALFSREWPESSTMGFVLSVLSLLIMPALAFRDRR